MKGAQFLCSCELFATSDSEVKMGDELTILLEAFHKIEKAGGQATLSISTVGGKTKVNLVTATNPAPPTVSPSTPSTPARRHRRRGARARARRNQRAAAHQASLAEAATTTSVPLEDPPHPLHILPSPPPASGRRRVMSVGRPDMPSFSSLNLDGNPPVPPSSLPTNPWIPCFDDCDIKEDHCEVCYRCCFICIEHGGCICYSVINQPNPDCSQCGQQLELGLDLGNLSK